MSIKNTSVMPRVLFLVSVTAVASVAVLLWLKFLRPMFAPIEQKVSELVEQIPVLPQSRRTLPDRFTIEIKTEDGERTDTSDSPLPQSSPSSGTVVIQQSQPITTTLLEQIFQTAPSYITQILSSVNWASPGTIGSSIPNSAVFTNVTTQGTLLAQGPVTMQQFASGFLLVNSTGGVSASRVSLSNSDHVADRLPTASGGTGNDFSNVGAGALLTFSSTGQMTTISPGTSGYVLTSNGAGVGWAAAPPAVVDWENPGTIGSNTPNTGDFTQLTATGTSTPLSVGSSSQLQVDDNGRMTIEYVGDSGFLSSSGGALFFDNTNNDGTGIGIYSNAGASAQGNMINVKVDNPNYAQAAFYMNYDGSSNAVEIVSNSDDTSSNALAVTGNNINDSTVGVIGYELGRGTIKVTHNRPGTGNDQNASGLSIDLKGVGTRAQGVYVDSTETGGTLGNLLRLRNESIDRFVVGPTGNVTIAGNVTQGANGTNTTYTKVGNTAGDEFFVGTNGAFRVQRSAGNSEAFRTQINGDTQGRWLGTSDGQLKWGSGTATQDVILRRGLAGTLFLDGGIFINNLNENIDSVIKGLTDSNLFYVDSSADAIGIGTSGPTAALHINKNAGTLPTFLINQLGTGNLMSAAASGVTQFVVANNGDVSIGTGTFNNPSASADAYVTGNLEVDGTIFGTLSGAITPTGFTQGSVVFAGSGGTLTQDNANFFWDDSTNRLGIGTITPQDPVGIYGANQVLTMGRGQLGVYSTDSQAADLGGMIVLGGQDGSSLQRSFGAIAGRKENSTSGNRSGYLQFSTRATGTGTDLVERMRIDSAGEVGIGTSNPGEELEVHTNQNSTTGVLVRNETAGTSATAAFAAQVGSSDVLTMMATSPSYSLVPAWSDAGVINTAQSALVLSSYDAAGVMRFQTGGLAASNVRMTIDSSGNVGIGATPSSLLTVGTTSPFLVDSSGNVTVGTNGTNTTITKNGNTAGDHFFVGTNGAFRVSRSASGSEAFRTQVNGDTQGRLVGTSDGRLSWGPGNATQDIVMRRNSTSVLALEGAMLINNTNLDFDTVIKGVADSNLFYVDASTDRIGIGTSGPGHKLTVVGGSTSLDVSNWLHFGSFATLSGNGSTTTLDATNAGGHIKLQTAGSERVRIDASGNVGIGTTTAGTSAVSALALANSTAPTTSITNGVQLFAVDVAGSHELQVRDEAGNVTTLSPHNFSLIPDGRSEDLAWSFYSERNGLAINADMTKALRVLEDMSGEKLVYLKNLSNGEEIETFEPGESLASQVQDSQNVLGAVTENFSFAETTLGLVKDIVVRAQATFQGAVEFLENVRFKAAVVFEQVVTFQGRLRVNRDTAGVVMVPAGATKVKVNFVRQFGDQPLVYLFAPQVFPGKYELGEVTTSSFLIELTQPQPLPISIQWWAVETQGGSPNIEVLEGAGVESSASPLPSPAAVTETPSPQPTASPSSEPSVAPSPVESPSPSSSLEPTPEPTPSPQVSPELTPEPSPGL